MKLGEILTIQEKSKIKAGDGIDNGIFPFFTCSNDVVKTHNFAQYKGPALIFGTGGKASVHFCSESFSTSTDCLVYKTSKEVNLSLVNKYLRKNMYLLENGFKGAGLKHISREYIANIEIPLPEILEQNKLVSQFDLIESSITNHKKMLEKYDTLIKSRFIEMFGDPVQNPMGWEVKKLGDMCSAIMNGTTPKGGEQVYVQNGVIFLRSQNVWRNRIDLEDVAYIDEATHKSMEKSSLKKYDILMTKTGRINTENSSLGRATLFLGEDNSANINGHVYLIRLYKNYNHEFVIRILTSPEYRDYIRSVCVGGIDKRQVNKDHIEDFPIIQPPIALQQQFAAFVQQIDKSKFEIWLTLQNYDIIEKECFKIWLISTSC